MMEFYLNILKDEIFDYYIKEWNVYSVCLLKLII